MASGDAPSVGDLIANCPDSHAEIASKMGVDKSLVTRWRSGARKPSAEQLAKLVELYGKRQAPPKLTVVPSTAQEYTPPQYPPPRLPPPPPATDEDNNARLQRYIREGLEELDTDMDLTAGKKAEALKKLVDAQVALDKSTGENAITMAKIAAHPEFKRVVRLITDALAPHPEALARVIAILEVNP